MAILTFGQLQKAGKLMFEGSGITVLQATTPTPSSDLPTTPEVLTFQHPPELELERRAERLKGVNFGGFHHTIMENSPTI